MNKAQQLVDSIEKLLGLPIKSYNGYVSVKPTPSSKSQVSDFMSGLGLSGMMDPDDLHVTIFYSNKSSIQDSPNYTREYDARLNGEIGLLGKYLVLGVDSQSLSDRHNELASAGGVSDYPSYIPHLSIKKNPTKDDLDKVKNIVVPKLSLVFHKEAMTMPKD